VDFRIAVPAGRARAQESAPTLTLRSSNDTLISVNGRLALGGSSKEISTAYDMLLLMLGGDDAQRWQKSSP